MIQLTPTSSTANGGSARPHGTSVPEPIAHAVLWPVLSGLY
jgi:hypothetical protein